MRAGKGGAEESGRTVDAARDWFRRLFFSNAVTYAGEAVIVAMVLLLGGLALPVLFETLRERRKKGKKR